MGEISSAIGFDRKDNLCVFYQCVIPEGWEFEDPWYTSSEEFGTFADDAELNVRESVTQFSTSTIK